MRENRTYRLSGGRRRALRWAPPPTRHRRSGGIEPTRPRGGKGAPAGGTGGENDGQHTAGGSRLHVTTPDSRPGQTSRRDGGGHRLASWPSGYATARSEAICRGAGCGRTRTSGSVGGQGQQRPWSTRCAPGMARSALSGAVNRCPKPSVIRNGPVYMRRVWQEGHASYPGRSAGLPRARAAERESDGRAEVSRGQKGRRSDTRPEQVNPARCRGFECRRRRSHGN